MQKGTKVTYAAIDFFTWSRASTPPNLFRCLLWKGATRN